jgi:hypothetical protein
MLPATMAMSPLVVAMSLLAFVAMSLSGLVAKSLLAMAMSITVEELPIARSQRQQYPGSHSQLHEPSL